MNSRTSVTGSESRLSAQAPTNNDPSAASSISEHVTDDVIVQKPTRSAIRAFDVKDTHLSGSSTSRLSKDIIPSILNQARVQDLVSASTTRPHSNDEPGVEAQKPTPLPAKCQRASIRKFRHGLITVYRRLFSIVFLANLATFFWYVHAWESVPSLESLSTIAVAIVANLFVASLFRTDYWINFLYTLVLWVPLWTPLFVRRRLAKVYEFGGVHSGAGVATAVWAIFFTVQITRAFITSVPCVDAAPLILTYLLISLLMTIILAAFPTFRRAQHNYFEAIHRFCAWGALAIFWALALLLNSSIAKAASKSFARSLFLSPVIYLLAATTLLTILPWLRLRRVPCYAQVLSSHAVRLYFQSPAMGPVKGVRISTSPLFEWHSFAAVPTNSAIGPRQQTPPRALAMQPVLRYSVLVSRAGDWTSNAISGQDNHTLRRYWMKGVPVRGVALVVRLFRRAVIVTTGSGIGPALSMLAGSETVPCKLVWSTPDPEKTYGSQVLREVHYADPHAIIWDTRKRGRPDMIKLTWEAFRDFDAEAVVVISNPKLTKAVVYAMESRGIPAYGPIFDS